MNRKIWKALGIAVCMLALAAPRAMAEKYEVWDDIGFKNAVQEINDESSDAENEIVLMQDITLKGNTTDYTLTNGKETTTKTTTIKGGGHTLRGGSNATIAVTGAKTVLNLGAENYTETLTIDGDVDAPRGPFVDIANGATVNMYEHVTLQNGEPFDTSSVHVSGEKSVFNLCGGVIQNCKEGTGTCAGAVMVDNRATFNMSGGEIRNCISARFGGGLYAKNSSKITITGGTISGCRGVMGGGLYVEGSTLTIERGTISGCTAMDNGGGLYAINSSTNSSTVNISGGTISGCTAMIGNGGGLYVDGSTITIEDGTISRCEGNLGCGLYATNSSEITIRGGTISGCTGLRGGGLYAEENSIITISGGTISGCKVGAGGGLFVTGSTLNIEGGTISECSTTLDRGKGGGLYAENSIITISGGTIKDNEAAHGGGVALTNSTVTDEQPIRNWTVVGNKAYKTGGGIWLGWGENVKKWDISDKSNKIYNNQAIEHGADICLEGDTSAITLPNAAGMGATFRDSGINIDNWYKDDNPRHKPSESGEVVDAGVELKGGLSLVASYKATSVYIKIDTNGGVGGSSSQEVQKGTTVILEAPTKEGHLFTGWKDEKGNSYPAGEDGKVKITVNENMTLTAVWNTQSFTVTYVLPDGKTRTETAAYGKNVTLVEETRTGYTFVGWKDGENVYRAGETITVTGNVTLTAVWKARTFTVTYVLLDGKTRTETAAYGENVTLVEEPRTGYTFVGWKDGEKMYHAGETITVTGNVTLTAEWKKLPSAENLPKTGDESPVLLWGAALAVSAAACFMLRRKK